MKTQKPKNKRVKTATKRVTQIAKKRNVLTIRQKDFLPYFVKALGNISKACEMAGITRKTYYEWLSNNPTFKRELEALDCQKIMDDFVVSKAMQRIDEGSDVLIKEYLNKRAKSIALWDEDKQEEVGTMIKVIIKGEEDADNE